MSSEDRTQKRIADLERSAGDPTNEAALVELARAYLDSGRHAAAAAKLDDRLSESGATLGLLEISLEAHQRAGTVDRVLDWFERDEPRLSGQSSYWQLRGRALELVGKLEEARRCHDKAIELDGRSAEGFFRLGVTQMRLAREKEAIAAFERAVELDPGMLKAFINLGLLHEQTGRSREAITCFRQAIAIDPRNVESRLNLGAAYGDLGKQKEAVAEFQAAIEIDANSVLAHFNLGVALLEDSPEEAHAALRRALALEPGHWEANYHLGLLSFKRGQYEAAIRSFQQCLDSRPDSVRALYHLGLAYNKKDQPGRAIECLTRVCELDPGNSRAHFYLGVAHDKKGQYEKARLCYQAADRLKKS